MEALLDNDVIKKITEYGFLLPFSNVLASAGYSQPHGRLASAPYKLAVRGRRAGRGWADAAKVAALDQFFTRETQAVTGASAQLIEALNVPYFDVGEVQLLARALEVPESHILTGDKNAIRALATDPALAQYAAPMKRRIIHFEMIVQRLCQDLSFASVKAAVTAHPDVDRGLFRIFSGNSENDAVSALKRSVDRLRSESDDLLIATL